MNLFFDFLRRYSAIWWLVGILYVVGNVFAPLTILITVIFAVSHLRKGNQRLVLLTLLVIFIMGDSRLWSMQFAKPLRIVMILVFFVQCVTGLVQRRYAFRSLLVVLIPFLLLSLVIVFRNPSPILSLSKGISFFLLFFIGLHTFNHMIREEGKELLRDLVLLAFLVFLLGLAFLFINPSVSMYYESGRYRGIFGNPNGIGIYATLMFPVIWLFMRVFKDKTSKGLRRAIWASLFVSVALSFSRNTMISIFLFWFLSRLHKTGFALPFLFYSIVIPSLVTLLSGNTLVSILKLIGLAEQLRADDLLTGSGRFFAWQWALEEFGKNPLFGRGFAFEEILFHDHMPQWLYETGHQGGVHNSYLAFLLNMGLVGLFLFLAFLLRLLSKIRPAYYIPAFLFSAGFSAFFEPWMNSSLNAFTVHFLLAILFYSNLAYIDPSLVEKKK